MKMLIGVHSVSQHVRSCTDALRVDAGTAPVSTARFEHTEKLFDTECQDLATSTSLLTSNSVCGLLINSARWMALQAITVREMLGEFTQILPFRPTAISNCFR